MHALIHYPQTERTFLGGVILLLVSLLLYATCRYPTGVYAGFRIFLTALSQFTSARCGLLAGTTIGVHWPPHRSPPLTFLPACPV